jgi:hypothetical protein
MTVQMSDRAVELPSSYLEAGHVAHGYAMTVHKAQGVTADRAFVLGTDDLYREMGYVAMSRGRLGNHLYVVGEPTREIEPLHGPSLERTNEELLVAALSTSRAQELASAQINPLASLDDRTLVEQWREACKLAESIPLDRSRDVRTGTADVEHLQGVLKAQKAQHARELATPRSLRDTLARRDERGLDSNRRMMMTEDRLTTASVSLRTARQSEELRTSILRQRPDGVAHRDALDAEIERRVGHLVDVQIGEPSAYVEKRIGGKPDDARIDSWTGGVREIERFRFENGITSETRAFGKHEEDWQTERHLDAVHREIDPPQRSRGMRR